MDTVRAQELVAQTGRQLLDMGLVARTWGNISSFYFPFLVILSSTRLYSS